MLSSTEEYSMIIANAVRDKIKTTWGLSEIGASGPSGHRYGDDAGHVCVAVSGPIEKSFTLGTNSIFREKNMWAFAKAGLDLLEECVRKNST